jgi:hypothetical protein
MGFLGLDGGVLFTGDANEMFIKTKATNNSVGGA